jgi:L,D-peptidoglycan transpeptidase YkuD (ErfK/YbiS/YcfS/YnhG family)
MQIIVKNKDTLLYDEFKFKCSIGKKGITSKKIEGDKKTPKGTYALGPVYFRKDRLPKPFTKLKVIQIKKNLGWCDDINSKFYNKPVKTNKKIRYEKLFRKDKNYDLLIPIQYNTIKTKKNKGSAIFLHLTKNYKKTLGCVTLKKKDMLILLKLIGKNTKIKIL